MRLSTASTGDSWEAKGLITDRLPARARPVSLGHRLSGAPREPRLTSTGHTRAELQRCGLTYQPAPAVGIASSKKLGDGHIREVGVCIPGFAVRECELRAFGDHVDVVGREKARPVQVEVLEQAQLLQKDRALAPRAALGDRPAMEF